MPDKKLSEHEITANLTLAGKISLWLTHKNLTQEHLGNSIGYSKAAISKMLRGLSPMNGQQLAKIAEVLGIRPVDLLFEPGAEALSTEYERAAQLLESLSADDLARWMQFGETLRNTK